MKTEANDAIAMLIADHREVQALFEQFEALSDRSKVSKKKLADEICHALSVHTQVEEDLFYPTVRDAIEQDDLMDEALVEHSAAKELIAEIRGMDPGDDLYDAKLTVLSEQIKHHVGEEEGDMFPAVRKSKLDLINLGQQMLALREKLETAAA